LAEAIRSRKLEIVKLLVEAGAILNVCDRTGRTPLDWAGGPDNKKIANYLRSKGAVHAPQAINYVEPDPLLNYVEAQVGFTSRLEPKSENKPSLFTVGIDDDQWCVFTYGMSDRAMNTPPEGEAYRFAELAVFVDSFSEQEGDSQCDWPIDWLRQLAQYPFENNTWFGGPVAVVANGEPPEPLGPGTEMTCWLLLAQKDPLDRVTLKDGRNVVFYTMFAIHTDERDFEREHGTEALLKKFAEHDVNELIQPRRQSVV
jgi:hypothetical protein